MQILTATDGGVVSFDNENYYTSAFSSYSEGAYVTMYAAPCNGYEFKGWRKGSSSAIISTSKSIRNLCVENTTYTAVFELKSGYLKQTITTAGNGMISTDIEGVNSFWGTKICIGAQKGHTFRLYQKANTGYHFDYWQYPVTNAEDDRLDEQNRAYPPKYGMIASFSGKANGSGTYTAHFAINEYTVTFHDIVPAENSSVGYEYDCKNQVTVKHGDTVKPYTATPGISETYKPYVGVGWSLYKRNGADDLFDFSTPITKNTDLYLQYKASGAKYQINVVASPAEGGIAMETNHYDDWYYKPGETAMLTADPNEGYEFVYWIEDTQLQRQYINQVNIRVSVNGNTTYTAVFRKTDANRSSYAVVVQGGAPYAATNGSQRKYEAAKGTKMKIIADPPPSSGLVFQKWNVVSGNVKLDDATSEVTTFTMPAGDVKIRAEYKTVYTVIYDANGGLGYMEEEYVASGDKLTLPECGYTAPDGMVFDKWELGKPGDKVSITADRTIKAVWKKASARTPGDLNGDTKIDLKDGLLISQHLAGWKVEINLSSADVNGDNKVDLKDGLLLKQFLAGWKVELV